MTEKSNNPIILHISTPRTWRGGEQQLAYLVKGSKEDFKHAILCPKGAELHEKLRGEPFDFKFFHKKNVLARVKTLIQILKKSQPAIIHTHDAKSHTIALTALLLSKKKVPLIVARRVDFAIAKSAMSKRKYEHPLVSKIVCVSHAIQRICESDLVKNKAKLTTIHSGVDISLAATSNPSNEIRKALPKGTFVFGCVAALAPHKDHATLIDAFALLKEKTGDKVHLVLIGEGDLRSSIEARISSKQLENYVTLLGYKTNVHALLKELDAFVISSKTEGLGTSIIDAMASGLPVIATAAGGIPELVENTGLLSPIQRPNDLADNMFQLYKDDLLRSELSSKSKLKAQDFSVESMVKKTKDLYRQILASE